MRYLWLLSIILLSCVGISFAQDVTIQTGEHMIRLRLGPGYEYAGLEAIPPSATVRLLAISDDGAWLNINYLSIEGWVAQAELTLPEDIALPVANSAFAPPSQSTDNCISLVGDSVAHGDVVYMVPGYGFGLVRTTPLSMILQENLTNNGLGYLEVRDHSASAAFLSDLGKYPYFTLPPYQALLEDRCRFTVIMPWVNDLSVERDQPATAHIEDMTIFLDQLRQANPDGDILILGFYYGQRAEFVETYARGYLPENIAAFNTAMAEACSPNGAWTEFDHITCVGTELIFGTAGLKHVVTQNTREEVEANLYEPAPDELASFFDAYWEANPDGLVIGDGVHLNAQGKQILTDALIKQLLWIDPKL